MTDTEHTLTADEMATLGELILEFAQAGVERFGSVEAFQSALETLNRGGTRDPIVTLEASGETS